MPRTVDHSKRDHIAQVALELMLERGAPSVSMSDIARAVGMKRPTLYWYFKDLGAIFEAVLLRVLTEHDAFVRAQVDAVEHPVDALYAQMVAVDAFFTGREGVVLVLFQLWGAAYGGSSTALDLGKRFLGPRRGAAIARLEEGVEAGVVAPCDPARLVDFVSACINGALVQRVSLTGNPSVVHETVWETVLKPLKREPS